MPQLDQHDKGVTPFRSPGIDVAALDNPIWNALTTEQHELALGARVARRFPSEIGPLSGLVEQTDAAYQALRALTGTDGVAALFLETPLVPRSGWSLIRDGLMSQMIWSGGSSPNLTLRSTPLPRKLTHEDGPAMLELAQLTEPGPFGRRTRELGDFFGIFESGRLVAMAGQRLHLPGLVEISAVCTHPDARGRGYASALMSEVIAGILQRGETPFLHVFANNDSAIRVYEGLGFTWRRSLHLVVLKAT